LRKITLLGQNVNAYRGVMEGGDIADFALLLEYVADIPGIARMRFVTSHPKEFTQRLIDAYAKIPQLVDHLYLPAQHGSDKILGAMKRGYTGLEYKSIIRRIRAVRPNMAISSDFIVGFPGETQADFDAMMKLIADVGFDNSYSFIFSKRPGTPAASLADDTPHEVKLARLQQLQAPSTPTRANTAWPWWVACKPSSSKAVRRRTPMTVNCKAARKTTASSISTPARTACN